MSFAFFIKLVVWSFQVMFTLLPSVGNYNDLVLVRVELRQSVYYFCNLSLSSCNLFASTGELMFRFRKQSSASRRAVEDTWSGRSLMYKENCL